MHKLVCAAIILLAGTFAASAQTGGTAGAPPPEVVKDLAPTGKLRAAINLGNGVLAQKDATGERARASPSISRASSPSALGVPVELVTFDAAGKVFEALKARRLGHRLPRDRAGARRRDRLHRALCADRGHLHGAEGFAAEGDRRRRPRRRAHRGRPGSAYDLYLTRTIKNATLVRAPTGGGGRYRPVPARQARGRGRREAAAGRVRQDQSERAGDGRPLHGDPAGDGHAQGPRARRAPICAASSRR